MGGLRLNHFGTILRRGTPWRSLSFALLTLALLGYAGLPSDPPTGLHRISDETALKASLHSPRARFIAPTQAKEQRGRVTLADIATSGGDPDAPALPPVHVELSVPYGADLSMRTVNADPVTDGVTGSKHPRAPPFRLAA